MISSATIGGRLTRDPAHHSFDSGKEKVSFCVANNQKRGGEEIASFMDCEAWGRDGENILRFFKKGSAIIVEGKLFQEHYKDKDGNNREKWKVTVRDWHFVESKSTGGRDDAARPGPADVNPNDVQDDSEIPF